MTAAEEGRATSSRPPADLVLVGGALFDGTGGPVQSNRAVLVREGTIVAVERFHAGWTPPSGARMLGGADAVLLPGYVDAHVHLCGVHAAETDVAVTARAIDQAQRAMAAGVTTLRDCGGPGYLTIELRRARDEGIWSGPRLIACGPPLTTTGGHCNWMGGRADDGRALRQRVRQVREAGGDFVKIMLTGGMSTPSSNPYQAQYSIEEVREAVQDAHRLGMHVAAHVLSNAGIRVAVAAGVDTIEHGWSITGADQDFTEDIADLVASASHDVIASVTAHRDLRALVGRGEREHQELLVRLTPHRALASRGVPLIVHSDADGSHTPLDEFGASIEVFRRGLGVSFEAALHAATGLAAKAVGLAGITGELLVGRRADVLVLPDDPREDYRRLNRPDHVVVDGVVVHPPRLRPRDASYGPT